MKLAWALLYPTDLDVSQTSQLGLEWVSLTIGAAKQKRSANIRFSRALQLGRINIRFLHSSRYTDVVRQFVLLALRLYLLHRNLGM